MCGFFGKKKNKREIVEKMKEKLVHRGPDAQGSFVNDSVALGFRRLSIIDLEGGLQPMKSSSQNLTVVFNGEIYNYQELREQMERVSQGLIPYVGGAHILTDDKAPVELLGMRVIDDLIQQELSYYQEIYREEGLSGLLNRF